MVSMGIKKTRNRIERLFRKLKERTKRFHNNINTKTVKYVEEIAKAITLLHNITTQNRDLEEVILGDLYSPLSFLPIHHSSLRFIPT